MNQITFKYTSTKNADEVFLKLFPLQYRRLQSFQLLKRKKKKEKKI